MLAHSFVVGAVDGVLVEVAQAEELDGAQGGEVLVEALLDEQAGKSVVKLAVDAAEQMVEEAFGLVGGEPGFILFQSDATRAAKLAFHLPKQKVFLYVRILLKD